MFNDLPKRLRHPAAWRSCADVLCAALCGAFAALGILSLGSPEAVVADWLSAVSAVLTALFILITAAGIRETGAKLPASVFALTLAVVASCCPPQLVQAAALALYIPLFAMLVLVVNWRGARLAALPLSLIFGWCLGDMEESAEIFPEASYLPASLMTEHRGGRMLTAGEGLPIDWWRELGYISVVDHIGSAADARRLRRSCGGYDVAVADVAERDPAFQRELYRLLCDRLDKGGVFIFPAAHAGALPEGDWRMVRLPGSDGTWLAAGNGFAPESDPEALDRRLQDFCRDEPPSSRLLLPGAFAALYLPEAPAELPTVGAAAEPRPLRLLWPWAVGALAAWLLLRAVGCRRENLATAASSGENLAAMTLYTLAMLPVWRRDCLYTGIPPQVLAAGVGLLLLPLGRGGNWRRIAGCALIGLLPLFPFARAIFVPQLCWFFWMLSGSSAMTSLLRGAPLPTWIGAAGGALAGAGAYLLLAGCGAAAFPAALVLSALLRVGILFRR